ncbi:MAG: hypothetical protein GYB66_00180 [Chloroflexi bacterium]|nr:hypothetical protein [Chloroflexota bacterium]
MERIKETPVIGSLLTIIDTYPRISAWVVLSAGIVGLLVYEARDVDLTFTNWVALIVASIVVSGLCIWIVSWEDEEELAAGDGTQARVTSESTPEPDDDTGAETSTPEDSPTENKEGELH